MPSARFRGRDYSQEPTSFGVWLGTDPVTAANFDAFIADVAALQTAAQDVSYIPMGQTFLVVDEAGGAATDANGQRESKARVRYRAVGGTKVYRVDVPAPILTGQLQPNSDFFDLTTTEWAAFVAAFEDVAREPGTNQVVEVINVEHVGAGGL